MVFTWNSIPFILFHAFEQIDLVCTVYAYYDIFDLAFEWKLNADFSIDALSFTPRSKLLFHLPFDKCNIVQLSRMYFITIAWHNKVI